MFNARKHLTMAANGHLLQPQCNSLRRCNSVVPTRTFQHYRIPSLVRANVQLPLFSCHARFQVTRSFYPTAPQSYRPVRASEAKLCCCKAAAPNSQLERTKWKTQAVSALTLLGILLISFGHPSQVQAAAQQTQGTEVFQLASEDSEFWVNVSRYGRYFITVLLGTAYISVKPVIELLKRPKTAFLVVAGVGVLYLFVSTTVQAMLGVSNPLDYQPSSFFPDNY